jgi:hypothetical protein
VVKLTLLYYSIDDSTGSDALDELFGVPGSGGGGSGGGGKQGGDNDDFFEDLQNFGAKKAPAKSPSAAKGKPMKLGGATKLSASAADDWDDW